MSILVVVLMPTVVTRTRESFYVQEILAHCHVTLFDVA